MDGVVGKAEERTGEVQGCHASTASPIRPWKAPYCVRIGKSWQEDAVRQPSERKHAGTPSCVVAGIELGHTPGSFEVTGYFAGIAD